MTRTGAVRWKVLIADDHKVVADGLAVSMGLIFEVVEQVHELKSLVAAIKRTSPDVVVLDITFDGVSSLPVMRQALESGEIVTRFVVLTAHESAALERAAFNAGAHAFLLKGVGTTELRFAIEAAAANRRHIAPAQWPVRGRAGRTMLNVEGILLGTNQVQVLLLLQEGLSRRQAAERLNITVRGVDFHLTVAKKAIGIRKLQLLLNWVAERRDALEAALEAEGVKS